MVSFLLAASLSLFAPSAHASTQTWIGSSGLGGAGLWSGTSNWTPATWGPGNTALFSGTAGAVTVGTETAGGLTFNTAGYSLTSGTLTLYGGSQISLTSGTTTFASTLSLAGTGGVITVAGPGTLSLNTTNGSLGTGASPVSWTVTGGTYSNGIFSSILSIGAGNNLGATPTSATTQLTLDGGTLVVTGTGLNPPIGPNRSFVVTANGGAIVDTGDNSASSYQNAIADNAGASTSLYLSNPGGATVFSGIISGTGGVTENASGAVTLSGTNTYSGGTTISSGTLSISTDSNLGNSGTQVKLNGGTLEVTSGLGSFTHTLNTGSTGGTIYLPSGGSLQINNFNANSAAVIGSGNITVNGGGQLTLSSTGDAVYSGNWTFNAGVVQVQEANALGSGTVTLASGVELSNGYNNNISNPINSNGGTLGFDSFSGGADSGPIMLTGTTLVALRDFYTTNNSISGGLSGPVSGTGALNVVTGTTGATLTLSGSNSYSGGTTVNSGVTVAINSDASLGQAGSQVTLGGGTLATTASVSSFSHIINTGSTGGTISLPASDGLEINHFSSNGAEITGSGNITVIGSGQLTLSSTGDAGYSGNWTFNGGLIQATQAGALGTGTAALAAGVELSNGYNNNISNPIISNGGTLGFDSFSGGTDSGPIMLTGTTLVALRDFYLTSSSISGGLTGPVSGTGGLNVVTGTTGATLTLSGSNSYSGGTTLSSGVTVAINSDASLGQAGSQVTLGGGTLATTANVSAFSHVINTGSSGGTFDLPASDGLQINNFNANSAAITGSGNITVIGGGQLTLSSSGDAVYSGNWNFTTGLVQVQAGNALGSGTVTLSSGAELSNGYNFTISNAITSNGGIIGFDDSTAGVYSGPISLSGSTTIALYDFFSPSTSVNGAISGPISGTGSLTIVGGGVGAGLSLTGSNSYSGGTTLASGVTVAINSDASLGQAGSTLTLGGGTLATTASIAGFSHVINTGSAGGTFDLPASEGLQINNFNANSAAITGSGNITVIGSGQLTLSSTGDAAYSGNWTLDGGLVQVQVANGLGSGSVTLASGVELSDGYTNNIANPIISNGGTLSFDSFDGGSYSGPITLNSTTTIGLRDFYSPSTARSGSISGSVSGPGGLTLTGAGTLTLSGSDPYLGATSVNSGTLIVTGSLTGTVSTSVASGAALEADGLINLSATNTVSGTLDGAGKIEALTAHGGVIAPGYTAADSLTSSGTLTAAGAVDLSGSTNFDIRLGMSASGTDSDQLAVTGPVSLSGSLNLTLGPGMGDLTAASVNTLYYVIISANQLVSGIFTNLPDDSTIKMNGYSFEISYDGTPAGLDDSGDDVVLKVTAVPEPGTWAMLFGGAGMLIFIQRRRRRANASHFRIFP